MKMGKIRLDSLLVERKLMDSREQAKRAVMAGLVFSEQSRLDKPGLKVDETIPITIKGKPIPYVGRGGLKLEKALQYFSISVMDKIVLDIGASTGGFTDCALQHGAKSCYAIDVGYNQLDWKLRNDDRVIVMERTNFRYVTPDILQYGVPEIATIDVSFISLRIILPVLKKLLAKNSNIVALIKPQFEAGRQQVGNKGIVRDKNVHLEVLRQITSFAINEGYQLYGLTFSPITGGDGNIEFLAYFGWQHEKEGLDQSMADLQAVVAEAHTTLKSQRS